MQSIAEEAVASAASLTSAVIDANSLVALVHALEATPRDDDEILRALTPFCGARGRRVDADAIAHGDPLGALVQVLLSSQVAIVCLAAATALGGVAAHLPDAVARAGAVRPLIGLLQQPGASGMHCAAARAVASLAQVPALRAQIAEQGAIAPLVTLLGPTIEPMTRRQAARALGNLSANAALHVLITEAGAIPPLLALLQPRSDAFVSSCAACALGNFATSAKLRAPIAKAGAVPPLVALLRETKDAVLPGHVARALGNLAKSPTLRGAIAETDAIPRLVALLRSDVEAVVRQKAARALGKLAMSDALCARIIAAGAIPPLALLADSGDPAVSTYACTAIQLLTSSKARLMALASNTHAVGALLRLARLGPAPKGHDAADQQYLLQALILDARAVMLDPEFCEHALASACSQYDSLTQEVGELRASHQQLLSQSALVSEPAAARHDVVFRCADGTQLGGSRALLMHGSTYFARQLGGGLAEGSRRVVDADPDFSSAAHEALLRQLHAGGRAPLPADPSVLLELLRLGCKLEPPSPTVSGGGSAAAELGTHGAGPGAAVAGRDLVRRVVSRCEEAVLGMLDADNCLDILRHARAAGAGSRIAETARRMVKANVKSIVSQPRWKAFMCEEPFEACTLMQAVAVDFADDAQPGCAAAGRRAERDAKRQRVSSASAA